MFPELVLTALAASVEDLLELETHLGIAEPDGEKKHRKQHLADVS